MLHSELTEKIIACAYTVYNHLVILSKRKGQSEMKTKKQTTILFLALTLLCVAGRASEAKDAGGQDAKPNVLFIAIDDLNDWTGMLKGNPQARFATVHLRQ